MLDVLLEYGLFLAQAVTIVLAIGAIVLIIAVTARKGQGADDAIEVTRLNERFDELSLPLKMAAMPAKSFKAEMKSERKARKAKSKKTDDSDRPRVYVLDFKGDMRASGGARLREEISAIIGFASAGEQVLLRLENAGGTVQDHGLAASQLARLKEHGLQLTIAVDKVAASGGYMMACIADHILAAPFAVLGSIGVLAQVPNVNRLLEGHGVDIEMFKGGEFKRTVTMLGKNTDADREKFQSEIDEVHHLFKQFVGEHRPQLDLEKVTTGEHWFGRDALALKLCDAISTSDDWLMARRKDADLLQVNFRHREPLAKRLGVAISDAPARAVERLLQKSWESRF
ncbi:MAG: serine protease SohB [Gammaproteobacteria bacterium]|jgi:serine protease SohB